MEPSPHASQPVKSALGEGTAAAIFKKTQRLLESEKPTLKAERAKGSIFQDLGDSDIMLGFGKRIANLLKDRGELDTRESIERGRNLNLKSQADFANPAIPFPNVGVGAGVIEGGSIPLGPRAI